MAALDQFLSIGSDIVLFFTPSLWVPLLPSLLMTYVIKSFLDRAQLNHEDGATCYSETSPEEHSLNHNRENLRPYITPHAHEIDACNKVLLENQTVAQPIKKFSAVYKTRSFNTVKNTVFWL
jgi:hypothetical protein